MKAYNFYTLQDELLAALAMAPYPYEVFPPDWQTMYSNALLYAEHRISRDLVLLAERVIDGSLSTVAGSRYLDMSMMYWGQLTVVENVSLVTPAGSNINPPEGIQTQPANSGTRISFDACSLDALDVAWPQESLTLAPDQATWIGRYWAMRDDHLVAISPTPDAAYQAVFTGLRGPQSLTECKSRTYVSTWYPDLLFAACMVFLSGALKRNFGSQADDPQQSMSWERTYMTLLGPAKDEELRRRTLGPDVLRPTAAAAAPAG